MLSCLNKRSRTRWTIEEDDPEPVAALTDGRASDDHLTHCETLVARPPEQIAALEQAVARATAQADALTSRRRQRRARRQSKNCRTLSKFGPTSAKFWRVQSAAPSNNQTQRRREILARQEMLRMREQVAALERRQSLLFALHMARQANAAHLVADKVRAYYASFARGYDPTRGNAAETESLLRCMMLPDVQSPAFRDLDTFLVQWANYSRYHAEITLHCEQIEPMEGDEPGTYTVQCVGHSSLRISRDTIKHFFQPLLADEEMVQRLVGKTYDFPFVSRFHFNSTGRVYRLEPRAELASGLFDLVVDPFSTVRMLGASKLTDDGCLHAYQDTGSAPQMRSPTVEAV